MNDGQLLRYSRHILLDEIGIEGQERLLKATALIVGAGGLGSPAALYLASAGVGRILLADGDTIDLTNLQRQILHAHDRLGQAKALSGQAALRSINPEVTVEALTSRLEGPMLDRLVAGVDVVLDCCDNFTTRQAVNAACVRHGVPLVSGAAIQFDGQISVYDPRNAASPCYACAFPPDVTFEEARCATMGVFAPLVGIIGSMQAAEALKLLAGVGQSLAGRLLMLDGRAMEWNEVRIPRNTNCPVCSSHIGTKQP